MKAKYLDLKNCYGLLPPIGGLSLFAQLDKCLHGINSAQGPLRGSIDVLVRQNQSTTTMVGSKRLKASPLEIAQAVHVEERSIQTQAVTRPFPGPAQLHVILGYKNGMAHKKIIPLQYLLKGWGDATLGHQCYIHTISENIQQGSVRSEELLDLIRRDTGNYYYVGITARSWLLRLDEHVREMSQGSPRLFYRAWREKFGQDGMAFTSALREVNLTYDEAMNWEEAEVDRIANDQYGLNMIPGGFKGLRYLHECRVIGSTKISLEERDQAIAEYHCQNPRKGLPNPFIEELWKDDEYYLRVIEGREKTLSADQVRSIRQLEQRGMSISEITTEIGAINEQQVKNVILGRTYKRVR